MRKRILITAAALLATAGIVLALVLTNRTPGGDAGKLQGTWQVVKVEGDGVDYSHKLTDKCRFIFSGSKVTLQDNFKAPECEFKLEPGKEPAEIDLAFKNPGKTAHGIYRIEGDTLRIAYSIPPGAARPVDFSGKSADPKVHVLNFTLKKSES